MSRRIRSPFSLVAAALLLSACGDEMTDTSEMPPMSQEGATKFRLRIENVSATSAQPTPLAPGLWVVGQGATPLFSAMTADRGEGLEALAEDGNPAPLAAAIAGHAEITSSGIFEQPSGATAPGPLLPGETYEFEISAKPGDGELQLATMVVQSNDLFLAGAMPIPLFGSDGMPLAERDITAMLDLWDAGTEVNQPPAAGPDQAPRQTSVNSGAREAVIRPFNDSTRALPSADRIAEVSVARVGDTFEITVANISATRGAMVTPLAPVFYAVHDDTWSLFSENGTASAGLEELAEDGSPAGLVAEHQSDAAVDSVGAAVTTVERPADPPGPAAPGERFQFSATPTGQHRFLSLAAMVVESNDAFLALPPTAVALADTQGMLRDATAIETDIRRQLSVWDAGTEINEVAGAGANQAPRQAAPNTGAADPDSRVRRHLDATNDLQTASDLFAVEVRDGMAAGSYEVTITNQSDATAYPTPITPVVWALHQQGVELFSIDTAATAELESLAEDGDGAPLAAAIASATGFGSSGVVAVPDGAMDPGPLFPGQSYTLSLTPDASHRFLSFAAMIVQSNDTILAPAPGGVALWDDLGMPRAAMDIAADLRAALGAFDAGTEANQVGATGPDQPLRQAAPNSGFGEGSGLVRSYDGNVWSYPEISDLARVTITPLQ